MINNDIENIIQISSDDAENNDNLNEITKLELFGGNKENEAVLKTDDPDADLRNLQREINLKENEIEYNSGEAPPIKV